MLGTAMTALKASAVSAANLRFNFPSQENSNAASVARSLNAVKKHH
jgi:hypothetical protein